MRKLIEVLVQQLLNLAVATTVKAKEKVHNTQLAATAARAPRAVAQEKLAARALGGGGANGGALIRIVDEDNKHNDDDANDREEFDLCGVQADDDHDDSDDDAVAIDVWLTGVSQYLCTIDVEIASEVLSNNSTSELSWAEASAVDATAAAEREQKRTAAVEHTAKVSNGDVAEEALNDFGPAIFTTVRAPDGAPKVVLHPPQPIAHVGNELELARNRQGEVSLHL